MSYKKKESQQEASISIFVLKILLQREILRNSIIKFLFECFDVSFEKGRKLLAIFVVRISFYSSIFHDLLQENLILTKKYAYLIRTDYYIRVKVLNVYSLIQLLAKNLRIWKDISFYK